MWILGGLYRSDDGGKTWRMLHHRLPHGHVRSVSVHPDNADDLLVAMGKRTWGQGVYRSVDGGVNWQRTLEADFMATTLRRREQPEWSWRVI